MKKQLMIIGMIILLLAVILSGCEETGDALKKTLSSNYVNEVQIVSHSIDTVIPFYNQEYKEITVVVKNIGNKNIDFVTLKGTFYNINNEQIFSYESGTSYLLPGTTGTVKFQMYDYKPYYNQYDHYNVEVVDVKIQ